MKHNVHTLIATWIAAPAAALLMAGCACKEKQTTPPPAQAPAPKPAPAAVEEGFAAVDIKSDLVHLRKRVPAAASLGEQFAYDLTVRALADVGYAIITDTIPNGATYVKSDPEAAKDGNQLTWKLANLRKDETRTIRVWLKADREGELAGCATVTAVPIGCVSTFVGKPALAIDKSGPETALLGADVTYTIVVKNNGTSVAKGVVVTDAVPEGMSHASGQSALTFNIGDLAPNESKSVQVTFKANKRGRVCNTAVANSANAGKVQDEACTVVQQPGLKITKTGDKEQFLSRTASYQIVVTNTGDTTLTGVVVSDTAPETTSIATAPGASVSGRTATWNIAELRPGGSQTFTLTLAATTAGNHCNTVTATAGNLRDSAQACTLWRGVPALLIEVVDDPDPIQVGETTTYTIRVTNQGTADDNNVVIVANFPKETTPTSASAGGTVDGQTVRFQAVPTLAPKQSVTYTIRAKGNTPGDSRLKVQLTSNLLKAPVTEEESTQVY